MSILKKIPAVLISAALMVITAAPTFANAKKDSLTFSSTQEFEKEFERYVGLPSSLGMQWDGKIVLPTFPNSEEESRDVKAIWEKVTSDRVARIKNQDLLSYTHFHRLKDKPKSDLLLALIQREIYSVVLAQKLHFDRVRPSIVNPSIKSVLPVPNHPAYPSGHSTQGHLFGYTFASLDPDNAKTHLDRGWDIAVNREYAGVHYRSDTKAGIQLAKAMMRELVKNKKFVALYLSAVEEWASPRDAKKSLKSFKQFSESK